MGKAIVETLKDEPLDVYLVCRWREMFWRGDSWEVYEENQATGKNELVIETQDEKEAIGALVSRD